VKVVSIVAFDPADDVISIQAACWLPPKSNTCCAMHGSKEENVTEQPRAFLTSMVTIVEIDHAAVHIDVGREHDAEAWPRSQSIHPRNTTKDVNTMVL